MNLKTGEEKHIEKQISRHRLFRGHIIDVAIDTITDAAGEITTREVVSHPGGVVALPVFENGDVLLIEQFRYAIGQTLLELPAGKLDPGERDYPQGAIERELLEETGYHASHWTPLTQLIPAPGFCNELLFLFRADGLVQIAEPEPFIQLCRMSPQQLKQLIANGQLQDGKTLALIGLYLAGLLPH